MDPRNVPNSERKSLPVYDFASLSVDDVILDSPAVVVAEAVMTDWARMGDARKVKARAVPRAQEGGIVTRGF